jgi:hypothetical protein
MRISRPINIVHHLRNATLPRLTRSLHHCCIDVQCKLATALINEYNGNREVGYTLDIQPDCIIYEVLSALLIEEEVIYKIFNDQCHEHNFCYYIRTLPDASSERVLDSEDEDNSKEEGPPTPEDLPW